MDILPGSMAFMFFLLFFSVVFNRGSWRTAASEQGEPAGMAASPNRRRASNRWLS